MDHHERHAPVIAPSDNRSSALTSEEAVNDAWASVDVQWNCRSAHSMKYIHKTRFSLRSLLITVALVAVAVTGLCGLYGWWTRPFVTIGRYPDGSCGYELWERRTFFLKYEFIRAVRYYPDGRKSYESVPGQRTYQTTFWSPEGEQVSQGEWAQYFDSTGGNLVEVDPDCRRPSENLLHWWNDW